MKVGIIAFGFHPGETGGTETYFRTLLQGLRRYDENNQYTLVVNQRYIAEAKQLISDTNWALLGFETRPNFSFRLARKIGINKLDDQAVLAKKISMLGFDVVHFPFQVVYPNGISAKKVLTFHDMQEKHLPEFFTKEEIKIREATFRPSVEEVDAVITDSDYTKRDIAHYFSPSLADKCRVVHLCYMQEDTKGGDLPLSLIGKHYFYYPAATWPHKNHDRLLRAFAKLVAKRPNYTLVLSGMSRQRAIKLEKQITELSLLSHVINLGYVDYSILPLIYQNAFALIYPSLFEGFGLPVLEAMAAGIPVLSSSSSSLPEVGGNAVIYFDPLKEAEILSSMLRLVEDKTIRTDLISKGKKQLTKFTLQKMTEETIKVYDRAYES